MEAPECLRHPTSTSMLILCGYENPQINYNTADCNKFFEDKSTSNMFLTFTAVHLILFPAEWTQMEAACWASHLQMSVPARTGMFNQRTRFRRPSAPRYLRWWCRHDFTTRSDVSGKGQKQCGVLGLLLAWKVCQLSRDLLKWRHSKICLKCQRSLFIDRWFWHVL